MKKIFLSDYEITEEVAQIRTIVRRFLADWYCWAVIGSSPAGANYSKSSGLCGNLLSFLSNNGVFGRYEQRKFSLELTRMFSEDGLDIDYPFGAMAFHLGRQRNNLHEDDLRVKWAFSQMTLAEAARVEKYITDFETRLAAIRYYKDGSPLRFS